jgi:DNA processing protein
MRGHLPGGPYVAIVGTRRPTDYGRQVTYRLAYDLAAAGIVIVSGLALGLDSVAHNAAIEAGGKTIAVLGTAIDRIYPTSNRGLAETILNGNGAILSEYEPGHEGHKGIFPARNRIISGLSLGVIVTEASSKSGSLITADFALKQNRSVMAVPGNILSPLSAGPNNLLRIGRATAVADVSDVFNELNLGQISQTPIKAQSQEEAIILDLLKQGLTSTQDLIERSQLGAAQFANVISLMEITGKIRNLGAGQWVTK